MRNELLLAFVPLALMAQIQPVRTVTSVAQRVGNQPVPGFQNGHLYFSDRVTIRAYSPEGSLLTFVVQISDARDTAQFLARSSFPKGLEPGMGHWQTRSIVVAQDRVGLFAFSGGYGNLNEWVELDFSGRLIRRVRLDQQECTPMAFLHQCVAFHVIVMGVVAEEDSSVGESETELFNGFLDGADIALVGTVNEDVALR